MTPPSPSPQPAPEAPLDEATREELAKTPRQRGKDWAYAVESVMMCFLTDFIDPLIGKWYQNRFGDKNRKGTLTQNVTGEVAGDLASIPIVLGAQRWFPRQMRQLGNLLGHMLDPFYTLAAHVSLRGWAQERGMTRDDPLYQEKQADWKREQKQHLAKTFVISASSIGVNIAAQKMMKNPHGIGTILMGKLLGTAITAATMLGARMAFPRQMDKLDHWASERFFAPMIERWESHTGDGHKEEGHREEHHARGRKEAPRAAQSARRVAAQGWYEEEEPSESAEEEIQAAPPGDRMLWQERRAAPEGARLR